MSNDKPEDLGIKIGTKEEAFWQGVITKTEIDLENLKHNQIIAEVILDFAKARKTAEELKK